MPSDSSPERAAAPTVTHVGDEAGVDPLVAALEAAVTAQPRRRVDLQVLRRAFADHDPTGATAATSRTRLADAISTLVERNTISTPRSPRLYETHLSPPLPLWVERPAKPKAPRTDRAPRVWRPELAAAAALATTERDHEALDQVDAFLRHGGADRPVVPHRERSIEVFGHEKRLDQLVRTRMFTSGALSLSLLRCSVPPLPLTAQHTAPPADVLDPRWDGQVHLLVVENHATYDSALRLSRDRSAAGSRPLAVGFGGGKQLANAIGGATQLDPVPTHIWYFGDVDDDGLGIPAAGSIAARSAQLPQLRPAIPLYRALLEHGIAQPSKAGPIAHGRAVRLAAWLEDDNLADAAVELMTAGERLAQEHIGFEILARLHTWT